MRNVFLTGATGTIGSALVPRLLQDEGAHVTLLLRAPDDDALRSRLQEMQAYWQMPADDARLGRIDAVRGDIARPGFGLAEDRLARLAGATTHIIHCAASVKLNMTLDEARATAVAPTRTVLELGRRGQRAGVLRKIDLVSTVGVWGRTPGHMPERRLPEVSDFHNTYEAAKAEAERVVWAEGQGLPITVHRPSMVVGESATGRVIHFQVFYHLCEFLSGARTFGVMPHLGHTRLDTVPVDWVADAIHWASAHEETAGRIFHLCAGPQGAIALPRLQERVRQAWRESGRALPRLRVVDRRWLERLVPLIGALAGAKTRRALRGLPPVLAYLAEEQGFANTESLAAFATAGLPLPAVESYLGPVLAFYLAHQTARHTA
ncbi:MAG: SDR family oxidoreductase [Rubrivivax sp.]|nr:SDR family oxidoreductase [Rubrivivax sp.]